MSDIHIRVLEYGRNHPGFKMDMLKETFPDDFSWIKREIQRNSIFQKDSNGNFHLSFDARSKLLEYEELHDARRSSRNAMRVAIASILLTLASLIYQFCSVSKVEVVNIENAIHHEIPSNYAHPTNGGEE